MGTYRLERKREKVSTYVVMFVEAAGRYFHDPGDLIEPGRD